MPTKGPSNRYGNIEHIPTEHTGYAWAKSFNRYSLDLHFSEHGQDYSSEEEYEAHAVEFANRIDRKNNKSFVDNKGSTYRYNSKTNEFAVVDKKGYVITYFKPKDGFNYYLKNKKMYNKRRGKK